MRFRPWLLRIILSLLFVYAALLIPDPDEAAPEWAGSSGFYWQADSLWQTAENLFVAAHKIPQSRLLLLQQQAYHDLNDSITNWNRSFPDPDSIRCQQFLTKCFYAAAIGAIKTPYSDSLEQAFDTIRSVFRYSMNQWDLSKVSNRNWAYRYLYGLRAASEEMQLQWPVTADTNEIVNGNSEREQQFVKALSQTIRPGDLLLSRGGADVSALIARASDYPGNFSHVALVISPNEVLEAHIEKGVALSSLSTYAHDLKLRCLLLRLRDTVSRQASLGRAVSFIRTLALKQHIPYDFAMDFKHPDKMFCSEVGSFAYQQTGVQLWKYPSYIHTKGAMNWLYHFGVRHFETQMPSDLEYDPQMQVVREWTDPMTLRKDHLDNAIMDVLLEEANQGLTPGYNHWMLPVARLLKGWGMLQNQFGIPSKIPEGMSATTALRNQWFSDRFQRLKWASEMNVQRFEQAHHYFPPYWQLIKAVRRASKAI